MNVSHMTRAHEARQTSYPVLPPRCKNDKATINKIHANASYIPIVMQGGIQKGVILQCLTPQPELLLVLQGKQNKIQTSSYQHQYTRKLDTAKWPMLRPLKTNEIPHNPAPSLFSFPKTPPAHSERGSSKDRPWAYNIAGQLYRIHREHQRHRTLF